MSTQDRRELAPLTDHHLVMASLRAVAEWHVAMGEGQATPFLALDAALAPAHIRTHVRALRHLTYAALAGTRDDPGRESAPLTSVLAQLPDRERAILLERIVADRPTTLQALGQRFGVSHQRVAQLESDFRARVTASLAPGTRFGTAVAGILSFVGPLMPLSRVLQHFPVLGDLIPGTREPVWRILPRVAGIEISQGWAGVPNLAAAVESTRAQLRELRLAPGVSIRSANRSLWPYTEDELRDWYAFCGQVCLQEYVVDPAPVVADAIAQLLFVAGTPLPPTTLTALLGRLGTRRSHATVMTALRDDPRFTRAADGTWSLEQPRVPLLDVQRTIRARVLERGPTPLRDIIAECRPLGVDEEAVAIHAAHGLFETQAGVVGLRHHPAPHVFPPAESPTAVWLGDCWGELIQVTERLLQTGSATIGTGLIGKLGLHFPARYEIPGLPDAAVVWETASPTVQLPLNLFGGYRPGERLLLKVGPRTGTVHRAAAPDPAAQGLAAALNAFGLRGHGDPQTDLRALTLALKLPPKSSLDAVRRACWNKRAFTAHAALASL